MSRLTLGKVLFFIGTLLFFFSFGADLVGLGDDAGSGPLQQVVTLISLIILVSGLFMWVSRKDFNFKSIPQSRITRLSVGQLLVFLGMVLAILALGADIFSIGFDYTIGETQVMGTMLGLIMIGGGFFLWGTRRDRPVRLLSASIFTRVISFLKARLQFIVRISAKERVLAAVFVTTLGFASIYFFNNIIPRIDADAPGLKQPTYFHESLHGIGSDFKVGIYLQSYMALHHSDLYVEHTKMSDYSNYPPFTHLFFMPLQLLNEAQAYKLIIIMLFFTNILVLAIVTLMLRDTLHPWITGSAAGYQSIGTFLFVGVLFYVLTGYPFLFSVERGNYDILAFFFSVLSIYLVIRKPQAMWWQIIALSIAVNLKIYPAALFVILFIKHGKRMILPTLIVNAALLLSLGYTNELKFFEVMLTYTLKPDVWAGNHSGFSFADLIVTTFPGLLSLQSRLEWLLTFLPLAVWGMSIYFIIRHFRSKIQSLLLFMVTIPLMLLFPSTSHDYALVILGAAILVQLAILLVIVYHTRGVWAFGLVFSLIGLLAFIDRSTYLFPPSWKIVSNKYPWVFLLSLLMLITVTQLNRILTRKQAVEIPIETAGQQDAVQPPPAA